jgi:hypothetical protein
MKKTIIALAVAAAMVPALAAAEGASVSGYTDITWTHDDNTNVFAAKAEIDFRNTTGSVTTGVDLDLGLGGTAGAALQHDEVNVEQAFFAWSAAENVTVIAGLFNNPIGLEKEDSIDKPTTKDSSIYHVLDAATSLHPGNNVSGLAVAYDAGVATVTVGLLNEIQVASGGKDDNSIALVINASPVENLDLELGYVTMDDTAGLMVPSALDINASYKMGAFGVTAEILDVDGLEDLMISLGGSFHVSDSTSIDIEYDITDAADAAALHVGESEIRLAAWHDLADNLTVGAGYNVTDNGAAGDDESVIIEFFTTF